MAKKLEIAIDDVQKEITELNEKNENISKRIQKSSGFEQDELNSEISELKQEYAGMIARRENFENKITELNRRGNALNDSTTMTKEEIELMAKEKGKNKKQELEKKKKILEDYEDMKRKYYLLKSNLSSLNSQYEDKKGQVQNLKNESRFLVKKIEDDEGEIKIKEGLDQNKKLIDELKNLLLRNKKIIVNEETNLLENEKTLAINIQIIKEMDIVKSKVAKLDICPLCQTKITKDHMKHVIDDSDEKINNANRGITSSEKDIEEIREKIQKIKEENNKDEMEITVREISIVKIESIPE